MIIQLLGLAPDADPNIVGVLTACSGVIPTVRGMKGAPSPTSAGMATLAATCQGAARLVKLDGTNRFIAGTGGKLYEAGASTWTDVSQAATYTAGSTARWRFAQQENVSFAANGADTLQASVSTGAFSCVAGAPIASIVETVGKFVFVANTSSASNQIRWSALGDYTDWTAAVATQSGIDTLEETPGGITAAKRFGNAIVVFKKSSMFLGINVGPPNIWQFELIPGSVGAMSQESVVSIGTPENPKLIFMGEDDFYVFDGARPVKIGTNRVKQEVFGDLLQSRYYACLAAHDTDNSIVRFWYPTNDSPNPNKCVVYNYLSDKWGRDDRQIEAAADFVSPSITYDGLGALYATYASFPNLSYDLAFAGSNQTVPVIFNTSHEIKKLTGMAEGTSFITGDLGDPQRFTTVNRVVPIFLQAPTTARLTNYYKNRTGDNLTTGTTTDISSGAFDFLFDARWHRLEMSFTGDWEMTGFSPEWERGGLE